jgi:hypothetical protein
MRRPHCAVNRTDCQPSPVTEILPYRQWRAQFLDENHRLRPQYEPRSLEAVSTIATPKGPNELW